MKNVEFIFQFPPVQGVFDTGEWKVYIFGDCHDSSIVDLLVHETLHYALQRVAGKRASLKLDRVWKEVK